MIAHSPARILLADQRDVERDSRHEADPGPLERALAALGHVPLRAGDGAPIALAALDASCGTAADTALAQRIHTLGADGTPVIVLAPAGAPPRFVEAAYGAGAVDVLASPLLPAALKAKVDYFLMAQQASAGLQRREEALRASEERYRTLFDSVDDGVCVIEMLFDDDGFACDYRFLETNPAFVKHTGFDDAIGKTIRELVPGHEAHWFDIYGKVASSGQPARFIDEARAMARWYDVYATRVGGEGSARVAVLFTDITERVHADAELRRLADDLAAADRRKSEFLATLAHELRNPLAPIRSGLQVLRMSGGDAQASARVHDIMERQLTHLVALVDDLLDVARITHGQIELKCVDIDLADVLTGAVETSRPLIDAEQHRLTLDLADQPLPLVADPTRLRQVVSNVLNNAAKYTPRGGNIVLTARRDGDSAVITVADDGIGIAPAVIGDVFGMFNQVGRDRHRARGGLGIGLSLVRSLVELHGGKVSAASPGAGQGSVFTVRLPLNTEPRVDPQAHRAPPTQVGALRVLVVDDNHDAATTLAELLGLVGHTVRVANSGSQALVQAADFGPQVVFLDIGMPGMNGYQTARALRAEPSDGMLLVALTGWGGDDDRARTREAGFDHHLTKPVDLDAVMRLLGQYAAGPAALPV